MKNVIKLLLIFVFVSVDVVAQQSAMTYNIRYATERDGVNQWENRKNWVANVVSFYEPNVLGIQEGLYTQVSFLDDALPNYSYVGVGRDDAKKEGEYAAIFYQKEKLNVLESGTFWLSETPNKPSYGWGAKYRRICTWAKFEVKETNQIYFVFNAHFDHETPLARLNSAKLMIEKISAWNKENLPVLLMGDLNATPDSPPIEFLNSRLNDTRLKAGIPVLGPEGTYNGFDTSHPLDKRIDYIFGNDRVLAKKYAVISETRESRTPSDHLPVFIEFDFK